jgi:hypothetical protein
MMLVLKRLSRAKHITARNELSRNLQEMENGAHDYG